VSLCETNHCLAAQNCNSPPFAIKFARSAIKFARSAIKFARSAIKFARSAIKFVRSAIKFVRSAIKFVRSAIKFVRSAIKFARSTNKFARSTNKFARSTNKFARSMNKFARSMNKFARSMNKFARSMVVRDPEWTADFSCRRRPFERWCWQPLEFPCYGRNGRQNHLSGRCESRGAVFDLACPQGESAGLERCWEDGHQIRGARVH
jgi:hypothetical protein